MSPADLPTDHDRNSLADHLDPEDVGAILDRTAVPVLGEAVGPYYHRERPRLVMAGCPRCGAEPGAPCLASRPAVGLAGSGMVVVPTAPRSSAR